MKLTLTLSHTRKHTIATLASDVFPLCNAARRGDTPMLSMLDNTTRVAITRAIGRLFAELQDFVGCQGATLLPSRFMIEDRIAETLLGPYRSFGGVLPVSPLFAMDMSDPSDSFARVQEYAGGAS